MYRSVMLPRGWWASIRTWYPEVDTGPRWLRGRGRCEEIELEMPLLGWQIALHGRGKRYRDLVGLHVGDNYIDWVIDEFDSEFNTLAIASMRYHLDYSVAVCKPSNREKYLDLIERLSEKRPHVCATEEQERVYDAWYGDVDTAEQLMEMFNRPTPPEIKEIYDDYDRRTDEYHARINQARHDFIDIMPTLWS